MALVLPDRLLLVSRGQINRHIHRSSQLIRSLPVMNRPRRKSHSLLRLHPFLVPPRIGYFFLFVLAGGGRRGLCFADTDLITSLYSVFLFIGTSAIFSAVAIIAFTSERS